MTRPLERCATALVLVSLVACGVPPATPGAAPSRTPLGAASQAGPPELTPEAICRTARALLVGATVDVVLTTGIRLTAKVVEIRAEAIVVQPKTRVPEPARTIALADVASIESSRSTLSRLGAFGLGALAGAGGVFAVILILMAHS
jgi:hypothetical protein